MIESIHEIVEIESPSFDAARSRVLVDNLERLFRETGADLSIERVPADGYGEYNAALVQKVPREAFSAIPNLQVGMPLATRTRSGGHAQVIVREIGPDAVTVDGNHPLAGKDLFFDIEIVEVRAASEEELAHQHVHGPGGHHH